MTRPKKILLTTGIIIVAFVAAVILFISPITKYLVEKYDKQFTGREIEMDWAYVNLFTGQIHFNDLKVYEYESDSVFFSTEGLSINVTMYKLFSKNYEISEIILNKPWGIILQRAEKHVFNFNDLIEKFASKKDSLEEDTAKEPVHFSILKVNINDGEFHYREDIIPVNYFVKKVNIESSGLTWNVDTTTVKYSFIPGEGSGEANGNMILNVKNMDYRLAAIIKNYDLGFIEQYMKDFSNYGTFRANMDADIHASGNLKEARDLSANGRVALNDFHFGKDPKEDFASFKKFIVGIIDLSPDNNKYVFDTISLQQPYGKYERYDYLDNIQNIFGQKGSNVKEANAAKEEHFNLILEIAEYVKKLAQNFFRSYYKVNRAEIIEGDLRYNDFALTEKFAIAANPFSFGGDSIDKNRKRVVLTAKSGIKPYGNLSVKLNINPKDSSDFDLNYHIKNIPLSAVNPYLIKYTSYPMDRGSIELKGDWHVLNGGISSENHFIVLDPRIADRMKNKGNNWVPVPLVMALLRERGNVIDYEVPITGDLNDPKFHLWDVILDVLKNIIIKPPTTGKGLNIKHTENAIEKTLAVTWGMNESAIDLDREYFVRKVADFLKENPEAYVTINPIQYTSKEKEHILLYEAKKKYFLQQNKKKPADYTWDDSLQVAKMDVKDPPFVKQLNGLVKGRLIFTIQDKCALYVGNDIVNKKYKNLVDQREKLIKQFFADNGTEKQLKFNSHKSDIPYNGYSYFKINFKGDFPPNLMEAYHKMDEFDSKPPRRKFREERKERRKNKQS